jgi:hypothetical protein
MLTDLRQQKNVASWLLSVLRPFAIADEVEIDEDSS